MALAYFPVRFLQKVSSVLMGLTALFGMGRGVSPSLKAPQKSLKGAGQAEIFDMRWFNIIIKILVIYM